MRCGTKSLPRPNLGLGRRSEIALSGRCALWPRVVVAAPLCQAVCGVGLRTRLALLSSAWLPRSTGTSNRLAESSFDEKIESHNRCFAERYIRLAEDEEAFAAKHDPGETDAAAE